MIFLTAIPDDYYFTWQLEIQLHNFNQLGILKENIHVLIGYDKRIGLSRCFSEIIEKFKTNASFFIYPDNRKAKKYPSSIRPHLMQQFFKNYPKLANETIFYYDTDVIFRELPDFHKMTKENSWYVSDTRTYLDSQYIQRTGGHSLFKKMCSIVGISPSLVAQNDPHCGGAQYLIKNTSVEFWEKVEKDCEALYTLMQLHNNDEAEKEYIKSKKKRSEYQGIQAWCADMWAVLWNAWLLQINVQVHKELDFCWSMSTIEDWNNKKILHYSGVIDKKNTQFFRKNNYIKYPPFYDYSLRNVPPNNCSYPLVKHIDNYKQALDNCRIALEDVTFLIPVRIDSESRMENLFQIIHYIDKHFVTKIIIAESDSCKKINPSFLPKCCNYYFIRDENPMFFRTRIINQLIGQAKTPFISIYDTDVVVPVLQIQESLKCLRSNLADMVYPYNGSFICVDNLFKKMFRKILDDKLFTLHHNKFITGTKRSFGGAVFIHREKYINAGMENEYFNSWGPEDLERQKRLKNLGYKVKRIQGALFHLPHERAANSFYQSLEHRVQYMEEYLKICRLNKTKLTEYIITWPWKISVN